MSATQTAQTAVDLPETERRESRSGEEGSADDVEEIGQSDCRHPPSYHEKGVSEEAINAAKRGRQCAFGSFACGCNQTRRSTRDYERSAQRYGDVNVEAGRLLGYPHARTRYTQVASALNRIDGREKRRNRRRRAPAKGGNIERSDLYFTICLDIWGRFLTSWRRRILR